NHHFQTPLTEPDVRQLRIGDSVTLDGIIFGVRDANLIRIFDQGVAPPVDWRGAALLHTAPNVRKVGPSKYEPLSVGTTTSMRMAANCSLKCKRKLKPERRRSCARWESHPDLIPRFNDLTIQRLNSRLEKRFQNYRGTWAWLVQRVSAVCLFFLIPVKIYTGWAARGKVPELPDALG